MTRFLKRHLWVVIVGAALVGSLAMGIRQSFGLFLPSMTADLGVGREAFAFAMALQNILWGVLTPFVGALADKYGSGKMVALGGASYALGLYIMSGAQGTFDLNLGAGLFIGFAQAATGFAVVLAVVARRAPPEKRSMALGIASAGGSFGQFYMVPVSLGLIENYGWSLSLFYIAGLAAVMVILATALTGKGADTAEGDPEQTLSEAVGVAGRDRSFWFLSTGFFVCGFQVAFIAVHLPSYLQDSGLDASVGATALALIGLFNIIGTFACGALGGKYPKKYLLSTLYLLRSAVIAVFLALPFSEFGVYIFASSLGLLWLGTVPLTSGLVGQIYGVRYMSTLFGIVFFSHQIGSFIGVWWGGYAFDTAGSYDPVWITCIILGIAAALLHMPITEPPLRPVAQEA
ncbi:MAG: MFS transporter [Proteobacteria bacterium]|nr:MFS transporter [Pseudomonadota bacterium]MDA1023853.1 MFS transporter [Pseudomonadota bacterium]